MVPKHKEKVLKYDQEILINVPVAAFVAWKKSVHVPVLAGALISKWSKSSRIIQTSDRLFLKDQLHEVSWLYSLAYPGFLQKQIREAPSLLLFILASLLTVNMNNYQAEFPHTSSQPRDNTSQSSGRMSLKSEKTYKLHLWSIMSSSKNGDVAYLNPDKWPVYTMSTDFTEHRKKQLEMGKKFKGLLKQKCPI